VCGGGGGRQPPNHPEDEEVEEGGREEEEEGEPPYHPTLDSPLRHGDCCLVGETISWKSYGNDIVTIG
jgi:hypothetical protein